MLNTANVYSSKISLNDIFTQQGCINYNKLYDISLKLQYMSGPVSKHHIRNFKQ